MQPRAVPTSKPRRAVKAKVALVQPKLEPDHEAETASNSVHLSSRHHGGSQDTTEEDVKPDVRALESLLDGLNLER